MGGLEAVLWRPDLRPTYLLNPVSNESEQDWILGDHPLEHGFVHFCHG